MDLKCAEEKVNAAVELEDYELADSLNAEVDRLNLIISQVNPL